MSDHPPEQESASPDEQRFFAPPPGYGEQSQQPPYGLQPPPYYQAGPPGGRSHLARYIILGVIGAVVLIGGIGAALFLLIGDKATPAASTTSKPPTASVSGPASLSVSTWYAKYVRPSVDKLSADINRLSAAARNDNGPALLADCQQMLTDVQAAQTDPTVSDPAIAADWAKVLGDFSAGASDCVSGVNNGGGSQVDRARTEILQGNTDAGKLVSDLEKLANGG